MASFGDVDNEVTVTLSVPEPEPEPIPPTDESGEGLDPGDSETGNDAPVGGPILPPPPPLHVTPDEPEQPSTGGEGGVIAEEGNTDTPDTAPLASEVAAELGATLPSESPVWTNDGDSLIGALIDGDGNQ